MSRQTAASASVKSGLAALCTVLGLSACATAPPTVGTPRIASGAGQRVRAYNRPYQVRGRWYTPADQPGYDRTGLASWYSYESPSRTTADGEPFDVRIATAAHTTLPIPSWLEVTNLDNGRRLRVRLNDRGPFVSGRILDVSRGAADQLGFLQKGTARVRVQYLGPAGPMSANAPVWASEAPPRRPLRASPAPGVVARAEVSPRLDPAAEVAEDLGATPSAFVDPPPIVARQGAVLEAQEPHPAAAAPASSSGGFVVQAGAFADRRNAELAAQRLAAAGPASIRPLMRGDGEMLYRVVVGGWTDGEDPDAARSRIAALGFADAEVMRP